MRKMPGTTRVVSASTCSTAGGGAPTSSSPRNRSVPCWRMSSRRLRLRVRLVESTASESAPAAERLPVRV